MFAQQMRTLPIRDEELARIRILAFIRHGEDAALVELERAVEFVFEVLGPVRFPALAGAGGVAALDHEAGDVAVEEGVVVVA